MSHRGPVFLGLSLSIAMLAASATARADVLITIDKSTQQMTVAVDGRTRWHWPVSTGRPGYDTPSGSYRTFRMEADHFSREWDDAPMPHSIFFTKKGHAIHGYLNTRNIGRPASHGCVRLEPENAAKLFALVKEEGLLKTKVVLTGNVRLALRRPPARTPRNVAAAPPDSRYYAPRHGEIVDEAPPLPPPTTVRRASEPPDNRYPDNRYYAPRRAEIADDEPPPPTARRASGPPVIFPLFGLFAPPPRYEQ